VSSSDNERNTGNCIVLDRSQRNGNKFNGCSPEFQENSIGKNGIIIFPCGRVAVFCFFRTAWRRSMTLHERFKRDGDVRYSKKENNIEFQRMY